MAASRAQMHELHEVVVKALTDNLTALANGQEVDDKPSTWVRVGGAMLKDNKVTLSQDRQLNTDERWTDCRTLWDAVLKALLTAFDKAGDGKPVDPHILRTAAVFLEMNGVNREAADKWKLEKELRQLSAEGFPSFND